MPRFFLPTVEPDILTLTGNDANHVARVLRARPGEALTVSDGCGTDAECRVLTVSSAEVTVEVTRRYLNTTEPKTKLHLYQCFPKGDKFETIVQKAVELGVASITPVLSERCVSRPDGKSQKTRVERAQKIAAEAAGQSGRGVIPQVRPFVSLKEAVRACEKPAVLFYEGGGINVRALPETDTLSVFIGPEGGFSPEEVSLLKETGAYTATLGARILRTETAGLAAAAILLYRYGDV